MQGPTESRLRLRTDLRISVHDGVDDTAYVIEDPLRGKFYRLGWREYSLVARLDGTLSNADLLAGVCGDGRNDAPTRDEAATVLQWATRMQLVESVAESPVVPGGAETPLAGAASLGAAPGKASANLFFVPLATFSPDRALDRLAPLGNLLFSRTFLAVWLATVGWAALEAFGRSDEIATASTAIFQPHRWLGLFGAWLALKAWHELGHALACKRFGGDTPKAGVALMFFAPVAFVDVTSSWRFPSKWQRIATAAAGMYLEILAASIALLAWTRLDEGSPRGLAFQVFLMAGLHTLLANANPLMRFDGYYILADLLEIPNLSAVARRMLGADVRRWVFGQRTEATSWCRFRSTAIRVYAVAAALWQIVLLLAIVTLILACSAWIGECLAWGLAAVWLAPVVWKTASAAWRIGRQPTPSRARMAAVASFAAMLTAWGAWSLSDSAWMRASVVVDYSPLVIVRATTGGFVESVLVDDGDAIAAGATIARLKNDELELQLADVERQIEQSRIQEQALAFQRELARQQIAQSQRLALEARREELRTQVDQLVIRSPAGGRVLGRNLSSLVGSHLSTGAVVARIGDEQTKELTVVIPQDACESFLAQLQRDVTFRLRGRRETTFPGRLTQVVPAVVRALPHPALSGACSGPIAVRPRAKTEASPRRPDGSSSEVLDYEPLVPVLCGVVSLSASVAAEVRAGQIGTVEFASPVASRLRHFMTSAQRWIREHASRSTPS